MNNIDGRQLPESVDLSKKINEEVENLEVAVFFFGQEKIGALIGIGLKFKSGLDVVFSCRGSGGIGVSKGAWQEMHNQFDETHLIQKVEGIGGRLLKVVQLESSLSMEFQIGKLFIKNYDDEFEVLLNEQPLAKSLFVRR